MQTGAALKLKKHELEAIKSFKKLLSEKFKLLEFKLFGSKARNDNNGEADIDIMVILEESNKDIISKIYDITFEINLEYDTFISPLIFNRTELEAGPLSEAPVYKIIQKEGINI